MFLKLQQILHKISINYFLNINNLALVFNKLYGQTYFEL